MKFAIPTGVSAIPRRLAGLLLTLGLALGGSVPIAAAATPLPPPELISVEELKDGSINIAWNMVANYAQIGGGKKQLEPDGPWGWRFNVYIEQTGEKINTETKVPFQPGDFTTSSFSYHPSASTFFKNHGTTKETRYCITMQSYVGDGYDASSVFSAESKRKCVGTQKVLIPTQSQGPSPFEPPAPPPPTKPDLSVSRVSGPTSAFDGATAVYEFVLWNDGTPAQGTAQIQIEALGPLTLDSLLELPDGFTCDTNDFGVACVGSLGGVNDPMISRGATFKMQMRGNGTGKATVIGDANHDRTLDELSFDNNMKMFDVTVN